MKWLAEPRDEAERFLRSALEMAANQVGDEMARRRVWSEIESLPLSQKVRGPRRGWLVPALSGALVTCGALAAFVLLPALRPASHVAAPALPVATTPPTTRPEPAPTTPRVDLGQGAEVELEPNAVLGWDADHRPSVDRGLARFQVAHQPAGKHFAVAAGPYLISVIGTKFSVRVTEGRVGVDVEEGVVEVWRGMRAVRLVAGDSWAGPLNEAVPPAAAAPKPSPARPNPVVASELREAQQALAAGQPAQAVAILRRLSHGNGATAENAAYELGRVLRDNLHRPREAVLAWSRYRTRFPRGLLRAEADLSLVETLASMGDHAAALVEAEAFLARHPSSERRDDVERIARRLRGAGGR